MAWLRLHRAHGRAAQHADPDQMELAAAAHRRSALAANLTAWRQHVYNTRMPQVGPWGALGRQCLSGISLGVSLGVSYPRRLPPYSCFGHIYLMCGVSFRCVQMHDVQVRQRRRAARAYHRWLQRRALAALAQHVARQAHTRTQEARSMRRCVMGSLPIFASVNCLAPYILTLSVLTLQVCNALPATGDSLAYWCLLCSGAAYAC